MAAGRSSVATALRSSVVSIAALATIACGSRAAETAETVAPAAGEIIASVSMLTPFDTPLPGVPNGGVLTAAGVNRGPFDARELVPYNTPIEGPCALDGQADADLLRIASRRNRPAGPELRTSVFGPGLPARGLDLVPRAGPGGVVSRSVQDPASRYAPGDTLRLVAAGALGLTIDLAVPPSVAVAVGGCVGTTCAAPPLGRDLEVTWPPTPRTSMHVEVRDEGRSILRCRQDGAAGRTTIHARHVAGASLELIARLDAEVLVRRDGWSTLFAITGRPQRVRLRPAR